MATMVQRLKQDRRAERGGTFRIIVGLHLGQGPVGCDCDQCKYGNSANHNYRARGKNDPEDYTGDIIETPVDLCARFNAGPSATKYERVHENAKYVSPTEE